MAFIFRPDTLNAIAAWALDPERAAKFGHIQGHAALVKGVTVPLDIWKRTIHKGAHMSILHVVAGFKKESIEQERKTLMWNHLGDHTLGNEIITLTHHDFLDFMKDSRIDSDWDLGKFFTSTQALIIIDTDPNVSTAFILAITAAVAYATSCDNVAMRVLTMSWEDLHPLVKDIFQHGKDVEVAQFALTDDMIADRADIVLQGNLEDVLKVILDRYPDSFHTVMLFDCGTNFVPPDGWFLEQLHGSNMDHIRLMCRMRPRILLDTASDL